MTIQRGFTLIEMAIVLVIITILIGGLAVPLSAQIQARRVAETSKTLEEAREAILGYAMTHTTDHDGDPDTPPRPYLPCPDWTGDGIEDRIDNGGIDDKKCSSSGPQHQNAGRFPWVTLGVAAQDAWGNRLHYAAQPELTNAQTGFYNGTRTPSTDWYQVCISHPCAPIGVADDVPVVLVSHGPNGWGARNINGTKLADPTSANELENLDDDSRYVSRAPTKAGDISGEFDDLTAWLSFNVIINRVCPAGGCP